MEESSWSVDSFAAIRSTLTPKYATPTKTFEVKEVVIKYFAENKIICLGKNLFFPKGHLAQKVNLPMLAIVGSISAHHVAYPADYPFEWTAVSEASKPPSTTHWEIAEIRGQYVGYEFWKRKQKLLP